MFKRKHPALQREAVWNLVSGSTIRGVLVNEAGPKLILRAASTYEPGREWVPADGEIIIDATSVDYVQVL
ncbi:Uncharacterised protein [Mycobacteroides abscessus subsp. abscessus]|nr:Uncharacterised protein [Mycobacteroides abscessus subsp. abscessus]SKT95738.1 Uncharacterised protein [Mycobacteroides abscessus subsp. massiliense]SKU14115.1 Uncharacterised protein [Mycobacteroides abscessus subsp. massiliense]